MHHFEFAAPCNINAPQSVLGSDYVNESIDRWCILLTDCGVSDISSRRQIMYILEVRR